MRFLLLIGLCIVSCACNNGDSYQRNYVISKSLETTADSEAVTEPQPE